MSPAQIGDPSEDLKIRNHQVNYSIIQLRLVGILIIFLFSTRILAFLLTFGSNHIQKMSALILASAALPLLPLGISLYLLGAGYRRHSREKNIPPLICKLLPTIAAFCGIVIPAAMLSILNHAYHTEYNRTLSPYESEIMGPYRLIQSMLFCWVTSAGLLLINRQMNSFFRKYKTKTPYDFFNSRRMTEIHINRKLTNIND